MPPLIGSRDRVRAWAPGQFQRRLLLIAVAGPHDINIRIIRAAHSIFNSVTFHYIDLQTTPSPLVRTYFAS